MLFKKLLPGYGWLALFLMLGIDLLVYNGSRVLTASLHHYDLSCRLDYMIPFVKEFIIVYIPLAFAQWIYGFILVAREEKEVCLGICSAEVTAKLLCLVCFLLVPTTMVRAQVTGTDFFSRCILLMYSTDPADNLLPSIHCLESYILLRTLPWMKKAPEWYRRASLPVTILVMASTLLVKQHVIVDVAGAVLVVEAGLAVGRRVKTRLTNSPVLR